MSDTFSPIVAPAGRPLLGPFEAPAVAPHCDTCGSVLAPDGMCLEVGACRRADTDAARKSRAGVTAKYVAAPAAWTGSGRVD